MPRADDAVELDLAQVEQRPHSGGSRLELAEHVEITRFSFSACTTAMAIVGAVVSKPTPMKITDLLRIIAGYLQRILRGINDAYITAFGTRFLEAGIAARDLKHIPEGGNDYIRQAGQGDGLVDVAVGGDADRATRAGEHLDSGRQ